ncbi:MAG: hypothetical protein CMC48_02960 [Flavobacteriaceae bacterium]|nr:hypothetical protein [Flavobacteriaceae bacterium]|tara:strand:- start:507 stop:1109 length:603 start_codon:yes stop_codon:yes gene_type:complete
MSRQIKFNLEGVLLQAPISKVDRAKLYGTSTREVYDENGDECTLSDLYQGSVILPKGSVSQVLIDKKGNYVSRSELIGFNRLNQKVEKVASIYSQENNCKKTSIEEFLSANIKSVYQLNIEHDNLESWKKCFLNNEIYHFIFNYREDFEGDDAYILSNGSDFFVIVGKQNEYEFLELDTISVESDEEDIADDDNLDFSMF